MRFDPVGIQDIQACWSAA